MSVNTYRKNLTFWVVGCIIIIMVYNRRSVVMKKFLSFISIAIVMTLIASAMLLIPTAAETEVVNSKNVVFVSDIVKDNETAKSEKWDGSSPDKPLYPTPVQAHEVSEKETEDGTKYGKYYLNTALYQAAEKLVDTGGTIVICGPVVIDDDDAYGSSKWTKDFVFPETDKRITITSVYNGVDYRTNGSGAYFGIGGAACILLSSPVTMENIKIKCLTWGRLICAQGNDLVMGDGITNDTESSGYLYPSVVGGMRFGNLDKDSSVTIKSGFYFYVMGSSWGLNGTTTDASGNTVFANPSYQTGDVNLNLLGGTYRGDVCGISAHLKDIYCDNKSVSATLTQNSVVVNGDVNITIGTKAYFGGSVYAYSSGAFGEEGHTVNVKVLGGAFFQNQRVKEKYNFATVPADGGIAPSSVILDLSVANMTSRTSGYTKDQLLNDMIVNKGNMTVMYPSSWLTSVTATTKPSNPSVIKGDVVTAEGAVLTASFTNKYDTSKTYNSTITYSKDNAAFSVVCDTSKARNVTTTYKYGTTTYHTETTNVVEAPEVSILGARLKITPSSNVNNTQEQTLRFVANYTNTLASGMTVTDKGILVVKAYMLTSPDKLNFENTYGMAVCKPASGSEYAAGTLKNFECDYTSINQKEFNTDYYARAYVKFTYGGKEYVKYSDVITRNPYTVALQATQDSSGETANAKTYLETNLINVFDNYSPTTQYTTDTQLQSLRDTVIAYMRLQANIEWTPAVTFALYNDGDVTVNADGSWSIEGSDRAEYGVGRKAIYEAGKTYKGIPYASSGWNDRRTSNYEHFTSLLVNGNTFPQTFGDYGTYNTLNVFSSPKCTSSWHSWSHDTISDCVSAYNSKTAGYFAAQTAQNRENAYQNYRMFPGSHCSQAVYTSWNNILDNKATVSRLSYTSNMVPGHNSGVIPVGSYVFNETTLRSDSMQIAQQFNTKEVMYASYDLLKPGDAIIHYGYDENGSGSGHTRLVISVDTANKKVKTLECANWNAPYVGVYSNDGTATTYSDIRTNWLELDYSYDYLIETGYLPITIEQLRTGLSDVQRVVLTDTDLGECLAAGTLEGWVKSNKSIDSVRPIIKDMNGNVIYDHVSFLLDEARHVDSFDLGKLDLSFALTSGTQYKFSLEVNTATSTENVAIVTDYVFTAK